MNSQMMTSVRSTPSSERSMFFKLIPESASVPLDSRHPDDLLECLDLLLEKIDDIDKAGAGAASPHLLPMRMFDASRGLVAQHDRIDGVQREHWGNEREHASSLRCLCG